MKKINPPQNLWLKKGQPTNMNDMEYYNKNKKRFSFYRTPNESLFFELSVYPEADEDIDLLVNFAILHHGKDSEQPMETFLTKWTIPKGKRGVLINPPSKIPFAESNNLFIKCEAQDVCIKIQQFVSDVDSSMAKPAKAVK